MRVNEKLIAELEADLLPELAAIRARKKAAKAAAEEAAKPRLVLPVSPETAERAQARPESVRISTVTEDAISVVERVRPREIVQVLEVDAEGRPKLSRNVDCGTADVSLVEYRGGYRLPPGTQHEYNPMDGLRRPEDE